MAGLGGWESIYNWAQKIHKQEWKKKPKWSDKALLAAVGGGSGSTNATGGDGLNNTGTWRELLGRRTWFFLHTLAAKYPEEPSEADKDGVRHMFAALGQHYPCPLCRLHLQ